MPGAIQQLLENPRVNPKVTPASARYSRSVGAAGRRELAHVGDPRHDTADFADSAPSNLSVDYVLPSKNLRIVDAGVFWPVKGAPGSELTGTFPFPSSDHHLVYIECEFLAPEDHVNGLCPDAHQPRPAV